MTLYLILSACAIFAVVIVSLCIAWVSRTTEPDRYEDDAQSDRDVQDVVDSARAQLEPTTRRVRGISS